MIIQQRPSTFSKNPQIVSSMVKSRRRSISPAEPAYRLAKVLVEQEKWQDAIAAYQQALTIAPTWVEVQRELGDLLLKLERWEEAVKMYETAITLQSDVAQVHHNLGDALLKLQRWDEAVVAYQKAIELNPDFSWSYNNLGDVLRTLERWDEAAQAYQNAINLKGDFALSHHNLGDVLVKKEDWEEAIAAYEKAIELDPNFAWSHYNLGDVLVKKEDWESAIAAYRSAVKLDTNLPQIHEKLGDALQHQIQSYSQEISQVYHRAVADNPTDLEVYYKALEVNPKDAEISLKLADVLKEQGKIEQAITFYKSTLQIEPNNAEIYVKLGDILLIKGNTGQAIKHYQNALQIQPNLSDIKSKLDDLVTKYGSVPNQLDTAQAVQEEQLFISARKHLLNQQYHQAIADCAQIMGLHSSIANIFPILSEAHTHQGKFKEAEVFLRNSQYIRYLIATQQVAKNWGAIITEELDPAQPKSVASNHNRINKIIIYTCVWRRPELTRIVLSYYAHLKKELAGKIHLELLAVGSEGEVSRQLCEECGFDYLEYPNEPLSSKWEYGLNRCADYDPDGVIIVGSDDIISQSLIEFYDHQLKDNLVFCGLKDAYFFDINNHNLVLWTGYSGKADPMRVGETIGMGRCLSRTLLDKLGFSIWSGLDINRSLDGAMTQKLLQLGLQLLEYDNCVVAQVDNREVKVGHCGFKMAEIGAFAVDIKLSDNVTPAERYFSRDASVLVPQPDPWEVLQRYFSDQIIQQLKEFFLLTSNTKPLQNVWHEAKKVEQLSRQFEEDKKTPIRVILDAETEIFQENKLLRYQLQQVQNELEEYYLKYVK